MTKSFKDINTIGDFYDALDKISNTHRNSDVKVKIGENTYKLSGQFYVEDEKTYYFLTESEDDEAAIPTELMWGIEREAEDDCWQACGFRCTNTYENCEVRIVEGTEDDFEDGNLAIYSVKKIYGVGTPLVAMPSWNENCPVIIEVEPIK